MLRLITSNFCGGGNSFQCHNLLRQFPRLKISTLLGKTHMKDVQQIKNYHNLEKNSRMKNGCPNSLQPAAKIKTIIMGCGGVTLGLVTNTFLQHYRYKVQCEGNRLASTVKIPLQQKSEKFDWKRFWLYLKSYIWKIIVVLVLTFIVIYINVKIPVILGDLINIAAESYNKDTTSISILQDVKKPALHLFSLYVTQSVFSSLSIYFLNQIGEKMAAKLRQDLFHQLIIQDIEFFDKNRTGDLLHRLTTDVQDFKLSFNIFLTQALQGFSKFVSGGISLFLISSHIPVIALASVPCVVMLMTYFLGKKLRRLNKNSETQLERSTSVCEKAILNVRTVHASASEYEEIDSFEHETNEVALLAEELGYGIAVFQGLTNCLNGLVLSVLLMGEYLLSKGSLSTMPPTLLFTIQGLQQSLTPSSMFIDIMIRGMSAGSRVFEYLQLQQKIHFLEDHKLPKAIIKGEIRFEDVSFAYPSRPDNVVLKNISLTISPGQIVALVGASGSGKSTIAALIERFYEPSLGTIKIDGCNIKEMSSHWLRDNILSYVGEHTVLFDTTIFKNIRYGNTLAKTEDVYEVAKLSQSHNFVSALNDGYETNVGEGGNQLSSDQRQRISIARALLKDPKVLILDDTASLLDDATSNRTTLIITNHLSTIRNADLIIVLDKGCIVESGKHEELMAKRGLYYDMVHKQENLKLINKNKIIKKSADGDGINVIEKSTQINKLSHKEKPAELSNIMIETQANFDGVKDIIKNDGSDFQNKSPHLTHKERQPELPGTTISEYSGDGNAIANGEKVNPKEVDGKKSSQEIIKTDVRNIEEKSTDGSVFKKHHGNENLEHTDRENNKSYQVNTSDNSNIEERSPHWIKDNAFYYVKKPVAWFGTIYKYIRHDSSIPKNKQESSEIEENENSQHNALNYVKKPLAWFSNVYKYIRHSSSIPKNEQKSSEIEENENNKHNTLSYVKKPIAWFGTIYKYIRNGSSIAKNKQESSEIEENKNSQHNALNYVKKPLAWFGSVYKYIRHDSSEPKKEQ